MNHTIGIGEAMTSGSRDDVLVTYFLGSCVGVALHDPSSGVGGLVHCLLPLSKADPEKAKERPHLFLDTGLSLLLQQLFDLGARRGSLVARAAGGATVLEGVGLFNIGERNVQVMRKVLEKNGVPVVGEDLGGTRVRSLTLEIGTGRTLVKAAGQEVSL